VTCDVKPMRHVTFIALILFGVAGALSVPGADTNVVSVSKVTITNLLAHKEEFKGKKVEVAGYYLGFFEHYALYTSEAQRDLTNSLWIDPFREQAAYKQNIPGGRSDFRGSVRVVGIFDYRPGYGCGHLGGWPAQITDLELFESTQGNGLTNRPQPTPR
jgi:hypothetical protein